MAASDYYKISEIAERMGVSKMTLYRMARRGELPGATPFGPRLIRVHRVTFDLWLDEHQTQDDPPADPWTGEHGDDAEEESESA